MKIAVIDNYDSFTWNLVHYLEEFCEEVKVFRNDEITADRLIEFTHIVISPGPGLPADSGITLEVIDKFHSTKKILGVCLGMQAIALYFGGKIYNLKEVKHGISSWCIVTDANENLYKGLPEKFEAGHYHSWAVDKTLPECLKITALNDDGLVMSLRHKTFDVCGVQYHPESLLTTTGKSIIKNWLSL